MSLFAICMQIYPCNKGRTAHCTNHCHRVPCRPQNGWFFPRPLEAGRVKCGPYLHGPDGPEIPPERKRKQYIYQTFRARGFRPFVRGCCRIRWKTDAKRDAFDVKVSCKGIA